MKSTDRYLSGLFLEKLAEEFTKESVKRALNACEEEFRGRMADREVTLEVRTELMDFWDAYQEFDELFSEEEKSPYQILQAIRRITTIK